MCPAADALDLDVVDQTHEQHAHRQAKRGRQISGGHDAKVVTEPQRRACAVPDLRQKVDGQHIHGVHQENPDDYSKREWRYDLAALGIANHAFRLLVDHLGHHLHRGLQAARHAGRGVPSDAPQEHAPQHAKHNGVKHRVEIEHTKVNNRFLLDSLEGKIHLQMLQMVLDVFARGRAGVMSSIFGSHVESNSLVGTKSPAAQQRQPAQFHAYHHRHEQ